MPDDPAGPVGDRPGPKGRTEPVKAGAGGLVAAVGYEGGGGEVARCRARTGDVEGVAGSGGSG